MVRLCVLVLVIFTNIDTVFGGEKNIINLGKVFVDSTSEKSIIDISDSDIFYNFSNNITSQSFKPYSYWIKFDAPNTGDYVLVSKNIFVDNFTLFTPNDNTWNIQRSGLLNIDSSWYSVLKIAIPESAKGKVCYIRLQSNCVSTIDVWLVDKQTLLSQELFKIGFYIFIISIISIFIIALIIIYFISRQKIIIIIALYSIASILMILFTNGFLYKLFPDFSLIFYKWSFVYIVDVYWGVATVLGFFLLDVFTYSTILKRLFYFMMGLLLFAMISPFFIERQIIAKIHFSIPMLFIFFNTISGFFLYFKYKIKNAVYLSIGWLFYFLLIIAWTISKTNYLEQSFFMDNAPVFGLILEFIIFVIIGVKQYLVERKERYLLKEKLTKIENYKIEIESNFFELYNSLSKREKEVLGLISKGYLDKEISEELSISLSTVRTYLKRIFIKLNVSNRTEASNIFNKLKSTQLI